MRTFLRALSLRLRFRARDGVIALVLFGTAGVGACSGPEGPGDSGDSGDNAGGASATTGGAPGLTTGGSSGAGGLGTAGSGGAGSSGAGGSSGGAGGSELPEVNAAGYIWQSLKIGGGGFVSGLVASHTEAHLIFARTDVGGAYRWIEDGQRWKPLTDWVSPDERGLMGVESIASDPSDPSRVYMLAGTSYFNGGKTAILRSTDRGDTFAVTEVTSQFTAHGNGLGRQSGERLAVDPNNGAVLYSGSREDGLFRSEDHGETWSLVPALAVTTTPNGNGVAFVVFDAASGLVNGHTKTIYVGVSRSGSSNLYKSLDGGLSFNAIAGEPTALVPQRAVLASDGDLYITYANGAGPHGSGADTMDDGAIWRYQPGAGNWSEVTPIDGVAFGSIDIDASNPERMVATTINTYRIQPYGYGDRIFFSTNGGTSWTDLFAAGGATMSSGTTPWIVNHALHWAGCIVIDPFDPARAFVTSGNGIFRSDNLGATASNWEFSTNGLEETVPLDFVSLPDGRGVSVIGDYDGFIHDDPAESPAAGRLSPTMGSTEGLAFAALAPNQLARAGSALQYSSNGGVDWSEISRPTATTGGRLAFSADAAVLLWTSGSSVRRRVNQSATWSQSTGIDFVSQPAADTINAAKFYAYNPDNGKFFVSLNGGVSFASTTTLPSYGARRIRAVPGVEGDVWVALYNGGLRRSTDSGSSFDAIAGIERCSAVGFGATAPGKTYPTVFVWGRVAGVDGIFRSIDAGASWSRINDDAHEFGGPGNGEFVTGDSLVFGRVYMGTVGRGIAWGELVEP